MKVLMCVPNISEGIDLSVVEQVVDTVRNVPGVMLLDYSSDADHNRSVISYIGRPDSVLAATQNLAKTALGLIDMTKQKGSHPRQGAVDVVPFVPIRGIGEDEAVKIARDFGRYVGKDDPVMFVRAQAGFPALGEILEPFSFPHLVAGWMRGSHTGPLMPVPLRYSQCTRFDGPPRVVGLGFQLAEGKLVGPSDLFDDPAFDMTRLKAQEIADYMRRHGPFMPHRLGPDEMEYTTLPEVLKSLKDRFRPGEEISEEPRID